LRLLVTHFDLFELFFMDLPSILDDLSSRFLLNVPEEDLETFERICFQIEQAHWFYEDFYREKDGSLPAFSLRHFAQKSNHILRN
jgi:mRNA-decapping enzyme subunit 2